MPLSGSVDLACPASRPRRLYRVQRPPDLSGDLIGGLASSYSRHAGTVIIKHLTNSTGGKNLSQSKRDSEMLLVHTRLPYGSGTQQTKRSPCCPHIGKPIGQALDPFNISIEHHAPLWTVLASSYSHVSLRFAFPRRRRLTKAEMRIISGTEGDGRV